MNKNRFDLTKVEIQHQGSKITLPAKPVEMTCSEAIEALKRHKASEEADVSIHEEVDTYPLDGAYAFMKVLQEIYGWATPIPTPSFFGPRPPEMVSLEIGYGQTTQVIWGRFDIPGIKEGNLSTGVSMKNNRRIFCIQGTVMKKYETQVKMIADAVREHVRMRSVYKNSAIRLVTSSDGELDIENPPTFMDLSKVDEGALMFSRAVTEQVGTNLFTPIEHTALCRKHGVPLRRGVLLAGAYGTGKTMTANVTAKKCVDHGWTFIYLDRVSALQEALLFARQYAPAVVFAEDIDRVTSGERGAAMDDVLNTIDGVDSKGFDILTILTTNFPEKIDKAMLRPGRLDAVISLTPPDAETAERLVRLYARGLISPDVRLEEAGKELAGQIPAVIREAVERSKLYAIGRSQVNGEMVLTGDDVAAAARGMKDHLQLLKPTEAVASPAERLGTALQDVVKESFNGRSRRLASRA